MQPRSFYRTVLEARVPAERAALLQETYQSAIEHLDAGIVQIWLLHGMRDPELWQIITLWKSRAALDAMRQSGETPRGVLIFHAAGAKPGVTMFDVASSAAAQE